MSIKVDFNAVRLGIKPSGQRKKHPLIGISVNIDTQTSRVHEAYVRSILEAGGVPILVPAVDDAAALQEIVENLDGLLLSGGADIDGAYFNEPTLEGLTEIDPERDRYDFLLLRIASDHQLPILGICRGMQVINVAFGGGLWQDLPSQFPGNPLNHSVLTQKSQPVHSVKIETDSVLFTLFGKEEVAVNSRHHQAVKEIASGFKVSATSADGVVEAIEAYPQRRILGVQWHPENMATEGNNGEMKRLFNHFVNEARLFKKAKRIHDECLTVDSHCDTPMLFAEHSIDIGRRNAVAQVDLVKMYEGKLDAVFVVAYLPQDYPKDKSGEYAKELLLTMQQQIEANGEYVGQARTFAEAEELKGQGRKAIFLGIENGKALEGNPENLISFKEMGVTYITLCHNGANDLCDSAMGESVHQGLSDLGKQVVQQMNGLGIAIDVSHASEVTFYDVLQSSRCPIIASHSSARALCDHLRNLTDEQIKALALSGGVVQVCLYSNFLIDEGKASVIDAVNHIEHIIEVGWVLCGLENKEVSLMLLPVWPPLYLVNSFRAYLKIIRLLDGCS